MQKCLEFSRASIYADDANKTIASDDVVKLIEDAHQELSNLSEWMRVNKLSPKPKNTEFKIMGHPLKTKNPDLLEVLKLNNCDIKRVDKAKALGVKITEKLNWNEQFRRIERKMSGGLVALKKLKNVIPQYQLCNVYYAVIENHLPYADVIWGSLSETKIAAFQCLQ